MMDGGVSWEARRAKRCLYLLLEAPLSSLSEAQGKCVGFGDACWGVAHERCFFDIRQDVFLCISNVSNATRDRDQVLQDSTSGCVLQKVVRNVSSQTLEADGDLWTNFAVMRVLLVVGLVCWFCFCCMLVCTSRGGARVADEEAEKTRSDLKKARQLPAPSDGLFCQRRSSEIISSFVASYSSRNSSFASDEPGGCGADVSRPTLLPPSRRTPFKKVAQGFISNDEDDMHARRAALQMQARRQGRAPVYDSTTPAPAIVPRRPSAQSQSSSVATVTEDGESNLAVDLHEGVEVCQFWKRVGWCRWGNECRFAHVRGKSTSPSARRSSTSTESTAMAYTVAPSARRSSTSTEWTAMA
eukprot:TRINITY_DN15983_c0_g1_i1.p1 TRINITY_DN15983_c0_g1~~TRINITY_DN15983_c0_g1_i1.p1  ORF type:complete len:356 (+),score=67.21 TRINITY_DN15983_c0_g1_i1:58-1125(+)